MISQLPNIEECKRIFKAIAMLDAIVMPEWEYRYYSFNSKWDADKMMASMRDGCGQHYFALFDKYGLIIKGFDNCSQTGIAFEQTGQVDNSVFANIPYEFIDFLNEPAFILDETTFCLWNLRKNERWQYNKAFKSDELTLLNILLEKATGYQKWAKEYYEVVLPINYVKDIFDLKPLNEDIIKSLNAEISLSDITEDIQEIDYPTEINQR